MKTKKMKLLDIVAYNVKKLPHGRQPEVVIGVELDAATFASVREVLGNPDVRSVVYSHKQDVIESVEVVVDGVRFRAHRSRPATAAEIARLDGPATTEHKIEYRTASAEGVER